MVPARNEIRKNGDLASTPSVIRVSAPPSGQLHCPPCREVRCQQCHADCNQHADRVTQWVAGGDAVDKSGDQARSPRAPARPMRAPPALNPSPRKQQQPHHLVLPRTQCHPHADFVSAPADGVSDRGEQADGGQGHAQNAQSQQQPCHRPLLRENLLHVSAKRYGADNREIPVHRPVAFRIDGAKSRGSPIVCTNSLHSNENTWVKGRNRYGWGVLMETDVLPCLDHAYNLVIFFAHSDRPSDGITIAPEAARHRIVNDDYRRFRRQVEFVKLAAAHNTGAHRSKEPRTHRVETYLEAVASTRRFHPRDYHPSRLAGFIGSQRWTP